MNTPAVGAVQESHHYYLARVLGAAGALSCAEDGHKIPIRWSDHDPDAVQLWLAQRGGVGTVWEQYGITHAVLSPLEGAPAGFVLPPTCTLVCIDVDVDPTRGVDGRRDLASLLASLGPLPATLVTSSPRSGGLHLWYTLPPGVVVAGSGKIQGLRGLDCKGNGGAYVGEIGRGRELLSGPHEVATMPDAWIAALPRAGEVRSTGTLARDGEREPDGEWVAYCTQSRAAVDGAGGGLEVKLLGKEAGARNLRFAPALAIALEHYNHRCVPPFSESEFTRRFRAFYDPGDVVEAQRFAAAVFADVFPEHVAAQSADPRAPTADAAPTAAPTRNSPLTLIAMPEAGATPTASAVAKYFAYHDAWKGRLRWDEFGQVVRGFDVDLGHGPMRGEALRDSDFALLRTWYTAVFRKEPGENELFKGVVQAALEHAYHPVRDYLRSCRAGVTCSAEVARELIAATCTQIFNGALSPIEVTFFRKTLLAAVRRAFTPGEKVDTVLLLVGGQGAFKSTLLAELFGRAWFGDSFIDIRQKDAAINIAGKWCYELAELASIRRDELERVRSFVTSSQDRYRAPYGKVSEDHPRQGVLCGTSNEQEVLHDPEGLRRWWPIGVVRPISIAAMREARNALWGLAMRLVELGEPHWLDAEEEQRAAVHRLSFTSSDPWLDDVQAYLKGKHTVTLRSALEIACRVSPEGAGSQASQRRLARLLRALGCQRVHGENGNHWEVPEVMRGPVAAVRPPGAQILQFPGTNIPE